MGSKISKKVINNDYIISIEYNGNSEYVNIKSIKLHNNTNYIYLNIPRILQKNNTIRNFKVNISYKNNDIYKSSKINLSLDKLSSKKHINNKKQLLYENSSGYNDEVIVRYDNNFIIKEFLIKI